MATERVYDTTRRCLILLALLLTACSGSLDETVSSEDEQLTRPAPTITPLPAASATTTPDGATLAGTVFSASDVGSQPDAPLADQLVLLLPAAQAPELLGVSELTEEALRFVSARIKQAPDQSAIRTGPDGEFSLSLEAGSYVLCLADAEGSNPNSPPYQTRGCAPLTVQEGEALTVEVSTMFGEIVLTRVP